MADAKVGRLIAAVIILVGAVLLIAALFTPWYTYEISGHGVSETANLYLGIPSTSGTVQYSCSGVPFCQSQTSYSQANLNNTGTIAEAAFFLLIGGLVLGIIAAVLGVASQRSSRRAAPAVMLAVVALILVIAAPGLFAAVLPGAFGNDTPGGHPANGPWNSFFGSSSTTFFDVTATTTWGPAIGWYLSIVAFVLLLVGAILLARSPGGLPQPATAPSSTAPVSSTMPPPTSGRGLAGQLLPPFGGVRDPRAPCPPSSYNSCYTPLRQRNLRSDESRRALQPIKPP